MAGTVAIVGILAIVVIIALLLWWFLRTPPGKKSNVGQPGASTDSIVTG